MRTLADMTPEERSHCRGMWGQHRTWGLVIISTTDGIQSRGINVEIVRFLHDGRPIITWEPTNSITPRDDLPRAWQADGTPPAGEWQTAKAKVILNVNAKYDPEQNVINGDGIADPDHEPRSSHDIRRWIGDWETIEEGEEA